MPGRPRGALPPEAIEAATRAIVSKLLHAPLARLRAEQDRESGLAQLEAARALFGLEAAAAAAADETAADEAAADEADDE